MNVSKFSFFAFFANVPIISSASYPSLTIIQIPRAFNIFSIYGTAILIPSGVSSLLALYSENISILS